MDNKFIIGTDNFNVGEIIYKIDKDNLLITELSITGHKQTFENLSAKEDGNWGWVLYPPKLYFYGVPFVYENNKIQKTVIQDSLDDYDVALYLMQHNDIWGNLMIDSNEVLTFGGFTFILGKTMNLEVKVNLKNI